VALISELVAAGVVVQVLGKLCRQTRKLRRDSVAVRAVTRHTQFRGSSWPWARFPASSFALRSDRCSVFFSGDTGLTAAFEEIGRRLGPFDLVMMEVGAFHPSWGTVRLGPV